MSISKRIREVRHTLSLTQTKFAERIAISTSYLAGIEAGSKKINDRVIRLISAEFSVDEQWLRTGQGNMYNEVATVGIVKITNIFKSLSAKYQECALAQISALSELYNENKNNSNGCKNNDIL